MKKESAVKKSSEQNQASDNISPRESYKIIVVDDEKEILQAYKDILNPQNNVVQIRSSRSKPAATTAPAAPSGGAVFEIVQASTGEEAVAEVQKALKENKPFAMGFFDVLLGTGIDGIETVRKIHELDPEMYAVLVTAYQDRHVNSIREVFGEKFQDRWDYLNKPFTEGEILQKARSMVSMWNLREKNKSQQLTLDSMKRQLAENEKVLTVAAVARSVGHEFGNILLQIMGKAELSINVSDAEKKKALETILAAADHASQVLTRFKNLSNPQTSQTSKDIQKTNVDIKKVILDTIMLMEHELHRRSIVPMYDFEQNLPEIQGDSSSLIQVFMNLVINATHAIEADGKIYFSVHKKDNSIQIKVRDTGKGISEENIEKIFDAFFTTKGSGGTGLGLCVCKEVIEINHQGKLSVTNHPQGGAEFEILLPIDGEGGDYE